MLKRRAKGEGSIFQRQDGRYCASVDLGIVNGKRKRKYVYGETRREVADKLKALHTQQAQGMDIAPERITVSAFLDLWVEQMIKPNRRPRTYQSYAHTIHFHILPRIGRYDLAKLTPAHVQAMMNDIAARGLSRTVLYARSVLSRALNRAVKWGYIHRNVATLTDTPRVEKRAITILTVEQCRVLLEVVKGHRLEALYRVALALGLRRGEVLALLSQSIDWEAHTLRVTGTLQRQDGKLEVNPPKTNAGQRTLPVPPTLAQALRIHHERQQKERQRAGEQWQEHGFVFTTRRGKPSEPDNIFRHFKALLHKAGLPETVRFHDMRHITATLLIAQGIHPRVIMEILGHANISVTMDIYAHVTLSDQQAAATKLDALFSDTEKE